MIVDLPEDATEIFVGDPKVANAVVRSARRLYISTLGQWPDDDLRARRRRAQDRRHRSFGRPRRRRIAAIAQRAMPGNDIQRQDGRRFDHPDGLGRLGGRCAEGARHRRAASSAPRCWAARRPRPRPPPAARARRRAGHPHRRRNAGTGKVINSLIIRGLDQVSSAVTISRNPPRHRQAARRQLWRGAGSGANALDVSNPFASTARSPPSSAHDRLDHRRHETDRRRCRPSSSEGVARTLAEPTVTAVSGERAKFLAGGTIPIPNGETCPAGTCTLELHPAALWRDAELHAGRAVAGPHSAAHRHRGHRHRLLARRSRSPRRPSPASARARTKRPSNCPRAARSPRPA